MSQTAGFSEHQLIHKFIHIGRYHRGFMENMLNKTGVYRSQHQILMYVAENPNVSQKELAGMYGCPALPLRFL